MCATTALESSPPREERPERHVGDELGGHGLAEPPVDLLRRLLLGTLPRVEGKLPVALDRDALLSREKEMGGRELSDGAIDRQGRRDAVEGQVVDEGDGIDLARERRVDEEALHLRAKGEEPGVVGVVQGLLADAVAGEEQGLQSPVPQRQREHPHEVLDEVLALLLPEVDEDLGVPLRAEAVAAPEEPLAKLREVVDLPVHHGHDRAVLIREGLRPAVEVDDREAAEAEAHGPLDEETLLVRPAMREDPSPPDQKLGIGRRRAVGQGTGDAAHARPRCPDSSRRWGWRPCPSRSCDGGPGTSWSSRSP